VVAATVALSGIPLLWGDPVLLRAMTFKMVASPCAVLPDSPDAVIIRDDLAVAIVRPLIGKSGRYSRGRDQADQAVPLLPT
jgi:hypothetical protein